MSQQDKGRYWRALVAAGHTFDKHYREYTEEFLAEEWRKHQATKGLPPDLPEDEQAPPQDLPPRQNPVPDAAASGGMVDTMEIPHSDEPILHKPSASATPVQDEADPTELPSQRLNQQDPDEELQPIRVDSLGRTWYQEEIRKPGYAKARGRRVLTYNDTGVVKESTKDGRFTEEFEVAGQGPAVASQVKVTLPSYQTGIYSTEQFPFKIHCYNDNEGFDFYEVAAYFNGADMVPESIKRKYVENVLCYDIRTVVNEIERQYRELQLARKV